MSRRDDLEAVRRVNERLAALRRVRDCPKCDPGGWLIDVDSPRRCNHEGDQ